MKTCPDCGERVYNLGCVNCNEAAYIEEQEMLTELYYVLESPPAADAVAKGAAYCESTTRDSKG